MLPWVTAALVPWSHVLLWNECHRKQNQSRVADIFPCHRRKAPSLSHKEAPSLAAVILQQLLITSFPKTSALLLSSASGISANPSGITFPISVGTFVILKSCSLCEPTRALGFVYIEDFTGASTCHPQWFSVAAGRVHKCFTKY